MGELGAALSRCPDLLELRLQEEQVLWYYGGIREVACLGGILPRSMSLDGDMLQALRLAIDENMALEL